MDLEQQIRYYNEMWGEAAHANTLQLGRCVKILESLLSLETLQPRICDLGCGTGWLSAILGSFGPTVGVDFSDTAIAGASKRYSNVEFVRADIMSWNHPKEAFDVVVSQEVIEHVDDQSRYLAIAHGLLRRGGHLILTTPNARTMNAMAEEVRRQWTEQPIENWVTRSQLRTLMAPFFHHVEATSFILTLGTKGTYRVVNSYKVQRLLSRIGLGSAWRNAACRLDYGLHLIARGQQR